MLGFAVSAGADTRADADYPSIPVDSNGPKRPFPFNAPYYLTGEPDENADVVQAVIVRKGSQCMFAGRGPNCYVVRQVLDSLVRAYGGTLPPGVWTLRGLAADLKGQGKSYVTTPYTREMLSDGVLITAPWKQGSSRKADSGGAGHDAGAGDDAAAAPAPGTITTVVNNITLAPGWIAAPSGAGDAGPTGADAGAAPAASADAGASDAGARDAAGPGDDKREFKLFVPSSDGFFLPGQSYCLLLFQHKTAQTSVPLDAPISSYVSALRGCADDTACRAKATTAFESAMRSSIKKFQEKGITERRLQAAKAATDAAMALVRGMADDPRADVCKDAGKEVADKAAAAAWSGSVKSGIEQAAEIAAKHVCDAPRSSEVAVIAAAADAAAEVAEQEQAIVDAEERFVSLKLPDMNALRDQISKALQHWKIDPRTRRSAVTFPAAQRVDLLRRALLAVVRRRDELRPGVVPAVEADLADREHVAVTRKPAGRGDKVVEIVPSSSLLLPNRDVSVRDLLELVEGRIRLGATYIEAPAVDDLLRSIMGSKITFTADEVDKLRSVRDQLRALDAAVQALSFAAGDRGAPAESGDRVVEQGLGAWLRPTLTPCQLSEGIVAAKDCVDPVLDPRTKKLTSDEGWPGYPDRRSPLSIVADDLAAFETAHDGWVKAETQGLAALKTTIGTAGLRDVAVPVDSEFSQTTWVSAYLTPVVGAVVPLPRGASPPFAAPYFGVQVHFVPNLVDDPLWSHGFSNDVKRAFAAEVGIATNNGPFGNDGRLHGPSGFPPIFVGAAVHLIPYTSFTFGGSALEQRASTLPQEQYKLFLSPFVAFSVQANVPDIIRVIVKGRNATTVGASPKADPKEEGN